MKASILSLVFLSGLAAAQIPACAAGCVTKFTTGTSIAGCGQLDIACICKNADFLNGIACCLTSACDKDGQTQAVEYAKQICSSAGVSTPDDVVCNENSSSATESATTTDHSSTTATTGSSESTTAESSETATADNSSSAPATTKSASRTTGSSATRASQTASSASQTSTNVAAPLASAGSLVGAAIAVLAAAL